MVISGDQIGLHDHGYLTGNLVDTGNVQQISREQVMGRGNALDALDTFDQTCSPLGSGSVAAAC